VAAGSAAVLSPGTELCSEENVQRLLREVKLSDVTLAPA
jgi:fructose-1-phosphate kinase PfkB-like protein